MLTLFHQIFTPANTGFMLKGLGMTIVIAVLAILISYVFRNDPGFDPHLCFRPF